MLRNGHNYYLAPSLRNKHEWTDFFQEFCVSPMDKVKEMFLRAERGWILEQINHENSDMFSQLMNKTSETKQQLWDH